MSKYILVATFLGVISLGYAFNFGINSKNKLPKVDNSTVYWMTWEQAVARLEADKAAGLKGKKFFVDIYTDWCGWCKKMDKETFEDPKIAQYLNKHFYPVKLNAEQRANILFGGNTFKFISQGNRGYHELAAALLDNKMSYPTVVFLNEKVELMQRIPGYIDVPTFDCIMHYLAEEHYTKTPWESFHNQCKSSALTHGPKIAEKQPKKEEIKEVADFKKIIMKKSGGVFTLPCRVNKMANLDFVFDTGAAVVVISSAEALFMYKHNYLIDSDFIGTTYIEVADGNVSENSRVMLREIDIDGLILKDVEAVIMENPSSPLLLGQSAFSKLGKITFDHESGALLIQKK